ncbi:MAG: cupin domain-containing protein [Chloroflexi bacterium]|nr:cupin domain-containing protein [Chloroflexota bacterium]
MAQKTDNQRTAIEAYNENAMAYRSPYERWKEAEGLPTIRGLSVPSLIDVELTQWASRGGSGIFVNLMGTDGFNDTYICEIPPGKSLNPIKHIYEETVFIIKGRGATSVWLDGGEKQTFEWGERSYFAMPPNANYQHHNGSGTEPARYVAMTAAPRVIDTFKSLEFVFNNPFVFEDRFDGKAGYFTQADAPNANGGWTTNFIADVDTSSKIADVKGGNEGRGAGSIGTGFNMVNSTVRSHASSWPVGTYKKAHRHGPGIHIVLLRGEGYSLMWKEGEDVQKVPWKPGTMFVPPEMWFHQHFNTGAEPCLFLAIGWGSEKPKAGGGAYVYKSVKEGGDQIEYEDEDPQIHKDFEAAVAASGAECGMGGIHPFCSFNP